ncbi:MAG: serine/threonine protein kinase [Actinomycetia bacterium]|nr:serine/threonine protein kinase [Actinomycetes bacterium]
MANELILQRYRLLENAGRGGFSTVEVAWDTRLQRKVAVKRLGQEQVQQRGLQEARTAALLKDARIIDIIDFQEVDGEALIFMEYIDGASLTQLMRESQELFSVDCVTAIAKDVGGALSYAHENQVLHLDIKPDNILFDHSGSAKVTDFGLAQLSSPQGFGNSLGGTIGYMPPEQITGGAVDERTDLWAFAVLLYQLLCGANPFRAADPQESLRRINTVHFYLPAEIREDVDPALDQLLLSALAAEANYRPPTVAAFCTALTPLLGDARIGRRELKSRVSTSINDDGGQAADQPTGAGGKSRTAASRANSGSLPTADTAAIDKLDGKARRKNRYGDGHNTPPWLRISDTGRRFLARLLTAIAAASTAFVGASGFGLLSLAGGGVATGAVWHPVGGSAEASYPLPSPHLLPSDFQQQLIVLIGVLLIIFFVTAAAPTLGSVLSLLVLVAGIFARGLVIMAIALLIAGLVWWISSGRRSWTRSLLPTLTPLAAALFVPFILPLLAGHLLKLRPAMASSLACWFFLLVLSSLSVPLPVLLAGDVVTPAATTALADTFFYASPLLAVNLEQLPPSLAASLANPLVWISLPAWLLASLLTCLPHRSQSQKPKSQIMCAVLATIILTIAILAVPLFAGVNAVPTAWLQLVCGLGFSLLLMILLIRIGVMDNQSLTLLKQDIKEVG